LAVTFASDCVTESDLLRGERHCREYRLLLEDKHGMRACKPNHVKWDHLFQQVATGPTHAPQRHCLGHLQKTDLLRRRRPH
jgi:hypothetical protein